MSEVRVVTVGIAGPAGAGLGSHESSTSLLHVSAVADEAARDALTPTAGQIVYVNADERYDAWDGAAWLEDVIHEPEAADTSPGSLVCLVEATTAKNVSNESLSSAIVYDEVHYDPDGVYNNVTGIFTLPAGRYDIAIVTAWDLNSSGKRGHVFDRTGGTVLPSDSIAGVTSGGGVSVNNIVMSSASGFIVTAVATFRVLGVQNSGNTRTVGPFAGDASAGLPPARTTCSIRYAGDSI